MAGMGGGVVSKLVGGGSKITVTGGSVLETDTHYIHFLTSVGSNPVVVEGAGSVDFLLVAGGGSGANGCPGGAGGGGGGGVIYQSDYNLTAGSYTVNVGGGRPTTASQGSPVSQKGNPTSGFGFTAEGGGAGLGGSHNPGDAVVQGGGGGGGNNQSSNSTAGGGSGSGHPGGTDIATPAPIATAGGWGSAGGDGKGIPGQPYGGGGGGGAGGAGTAHPGGFSNTGTFYGKGGDGAIYTISGKPLYYGAGGGGGYGQESPSPDLSGGIGGHGGAGDGGMSTTHPFCVDGTSGTQFGAGGGGHGYYSSACGTGGGSYQGVAILRYLKANSTERTVSALSASGGNVNGLEPGNGYKYHTFTGPGSFQVNSGTADIEILIVGAGGGTAASTDCCVGHGGGGAGGILYGALNVSPGSYGVTIGTGVAASNGNNTVFGSHTALGGGRGGYYTASVSRGTHGGSGGGAGWYGPSTSRELYGHRGIQSPSGTLVGYGNRGGHSSPVGGVNSFNNGGGGGAGAAGTPGGLTSDGTSGAGGIGLQFPQFTGTLIGVPALNPQNGYFGGGGGSGVRSNGTGTGGTGGSGGGGAGGPNGNQGTNGTANTGGGGGGPSGGAGGSSTTGGSGIVVIRYRV